jgi:hypothetical protein
LGLAGLNAPATARNGFGSGNHSNIAFVEDARSTLYPDTEMGF